MLTPILSSISLVVRGTEQKFTMSLCLLDYDTFGVSECLSPVSWSVSECLSPVSWSVSECLSPVLWSSTWLLSPSTWLLSSLQTVMTNSCALSLFINVTLSRIFFELLLTHSNSITTKGATSTYKNGIHNQYWRWSQKGVDSELSQRCLY